MLVTSCLPEVHLNPWTQKGWDSTNVRWLPGTEQANHQEQPYNSPYRRLVWSDGTGKGVLNARSTKRMLPTKENCEVRAKIACITRYGSYELSIFNIIFYLHYPTTNKLANCSWVHNQKLAQTQRLPAGHECTKKSHIPTAILQHYIVKPWKHIT